MHSWSNQQRFLWGLFISCLIGGNVALSQGLEVWRVDFELFLHPGGWVRDFDLRTPAVAKRVIVGLNVFPKQQFHEVYIYEAGVSWNSVKNYIRLKHRYDKNLQGRSVVRNGSRDGYIIAMIEYKTLGLDTQLAVVHIDTNGIQRWWKALIVHDLQGIPYEVVMPTKIVEYRDSVYLICGYARQGEQQDVFLLQIDEQGTVQWVRIYRDEATADHEVSPLWCWDMEVGPSGEVVLVGSRQTRFTVSMPPAGCINEREQGWLLVVNGATGIPISNMVYVEPKGQCTVLRGVRIAEDRQRRERWVFAV